MSKENTTQDEVNGVLWKACDTFRGTVEAAQYKDYILVMLFVKYISDTWQERYDELKEQYNGDEELILRRMNRDRFSIPKGCHFKDLYNARDESNIGERINNALSQIEDANREKLQGVFRNIDFNSEANLGQTKDRNGRLRHLLNDFADPRLDLRPSRIGNQDIIGNAYEFLISKFAAGAGKKAGEFYTPAEVSELIVELVDPQAGERICDPTCGSGSLLIKCGAQLKNRGINDFSLYGQEITGATWALAKMNMFLHGMDNARVEWGDTIRSPKLLENDRTMKFEVVVANPPFSLDKWGHEEVSNDAYNRFHRGLPPKSKGDYAFISHMLETTTVNSGRVAVVVPHGVLFRSAAEGKIRQKLIEENLLDAVIGLPANLFFGTGIPAAIMVLKRNKADKNVMFIDASSDYNSDKTQNRLRPEDVEKIVSAYKARKTVDKYAYLASADEIKENDYNLNIPRYVDTFEEEEEIDIEDVQQRIIEIEKELSETESEMQKHLKELGYAA